MSDNITQGTNPEVTDDTEIVIEDVVEGSTTVYNDELLDDAEVDDKDIDTDVDVDTDVEAEPVDDIVPEDDTTTVDYNLSPTAIRSFREGLSVSRALVSKETGLSGSVVWRAEQEGKSVSDDQRTMIIDFLTRIDRDGKPQTTSTRTVTPRRSTGTRRLRSMSVEDNNQLAKARAALLAAEAKIADLTSAHAIDMKRVTDELARYEDGADAVLKHDLEESEYKRMGLESDLAELEENSQKLVDSINAKHAQFIATLRQAVETEITTARQKKQAVGGLTTILAMIS